MKMTESEIDAAVKEIVRSALDHELMDPDEASLEDSSRFLRGVIEELRDELLALEQSS